MVWDNCGPHTVQGMRQPFAEWGVKVRELPPKMTDISQVMDLVVNASLKAAIRGMRSQALFSYFHKWKILRLTAPAHQDKPPPPPFRPPNKASRGERDTDCVAMHTIDTRQFRFW